MNFLDTHSVESSVERYKLKSWKTTWTLSLPRPWKSYLHVVREGYGAGYEGLWIVPFLIMSLLTVTSQLDPETIYRSQGCLRYACFYLKENKFVKYTACSRLLFRMINSWRNWVATNLRLFIQIVC